MPQSLASVPLAQQAAATSAQVLEWLAASGDRGILGCAVLSFSNPTYRTEPLGHHLAKRSQFIKAFKNLVVWVAHTAAEAVAGGFGIAKETTLITAAVAAITFDRPRLASAYAFRRHQGSLAQQLQQLLNARSFFGRFLEAATPRSGDECPVEHPTIFSDLKNEIEPHFANSDRCIYDALDELLSDSPKDLKELPLLVSLAGGTFFGYLGHSCTAKHLPLVEAVARRFNLQDCGVLLCFSRLAMRAHGTFIIALDDFAPALDGDGWEVHHNPGIASLPALMRELRKCLKETDGYRLAVLRSRKEFVQILRFACRLQQAALRCMSRLQGAFPSGSVFEFRNRLSNVTALEISGAAAAAAVSGEDFFITSTLHAIDCLVHIAYCVNILPSRQKLRAAIRMQDFLYIFMGYDVQARVASLMLPLVHHLRLAPWLHASSNIAQFSRHILISLTEACPRLFVVREILYGRVDDFWKAVDAVVGPIETGDMLQDSGSADKILSFFRNIVTRMEMEHVDVDYCPLAQLFSHFLRFLIEGVVPPCHRNTNVDLWLQQVTFQQLVVLLLRWAKDVDVPVRLLGVCMHVAAKFISDVIASCCPVPQHPLFILKYLNRFVDAAKAIQLLYPNWSCLKAFDVYQIALGVALHSLDNIGTHSNPTVDRTVCTNKRSDSIFLLGCCKVSTKWTVKQVTRMNCAFQIIVRREIEAVHVAAADSQHFARAFWTDDVSLHLHYIKMISQTYLPRGISTPLSVNHPILPPNIDECSKDIAKNEHIMPVLKNHNDSLRLACHADLLRVRVFARRCSDLLQISRRLRERSAALKCAADDREASIVRDVLSKELSDKGAWFLRVLGDLGSMIADCRESRMSFSHSNLVRNYPEIARLSAHSIHVRQSLEMLESIMRIANYRLEQQQQQQQQQQRQQRQQQQQQQHIAGICSLGPPGHGDSDRRSLLQAEAIRKLDTTTIWFLLCDVVRICGEGAKKAQRREQDGILKPVLSFVNRISGALTSENYVVPIKHGRELGEALLAALLLEHNCVRVAINDAHWTPRFIVPSASADNAGRSISVTHDADMASIMIVNGEQVSVVRGFDRVCVSDGLRWIQQPRILAPHLAEIILDREQYGRLFRRGTDLLRVMSGIEGHLKTKIPAVMMHRIVEEVFSISKTHHSQLYAALIDIQSHESFDSVKNAYHALSVPQLSMGLGAITLAFTLFPINVVLTQLYFGESFSGHNIMPASGQDIMPLKLPLSLALGSGGFAGSALYLFVDQCNKDSESGELNSSKLGLKIACAAVLFFAFGFFFGAALEDQDAVAEYWVCILLMVVAMAAALIVFVRNLMPALTNKYARMLFGLWSDEDARKMREDAP